MVEGFEDGDLEAVFGQIARAGETAGAAADDGYLATRRIAGALRLGACAMVVGDEAFEGADGDGLVLDAHHAAAFALRFLRTYAAADGWQSRVVAEGDVGLVEVFLLDVLDEEGNVDAHGAGFDAAGLFALQTAVGLEDGLALGEAE